MKIDPDELAFDLDGVIANTYQYCINFANREWGYKIKYKSLTEYSFMSVIPDKKRIQELLDHINGHLHMIDIFPYKGAMEVLTNIASKGKLTIISARPMQYPIEMWLHKCMPNLNMSNLNLEVMIMNTKRTYKNFGREKVYSLKRNHIKYYIDDCLETCFTISNQGIIPIVFNQPWNRKSHKFIKVNNWDDIKNIIDDKINAKVSENNDDKDK